MPDGRLLPGWPRGMSEDLAAAYVGMSAATMRREIVAGRFPSPRHISPGRLAWDKKDLDAWWDRLESGEAQRQSHADLLMTG